MWIYNNTGEKETRAGFGDALVQLAHNNTLVIALSADLTGSLKIEPIRKALPQQFIQTGISEANMICVASGLSIAGKIPFATGFANFITGRVYDQIRQSVAYSNQNVKICASHAGLTLGEDGATHQILEDIGLMKMLPNMTVINTCDYNQTFAATLSIAKYIGPVYLRFGRPKVPNFTDPSETFIIGKAKKLKSGKDVSIIATGHLVWEALVASEELSKSYDIEAAVINIHTIKPLDSDCIIDEALTTRAIVTAEEHQRNGGLGDSVAQVLSMNQPCIQEYVAVHDTFGESGTPKQLMDKYNLNARTIIKACIKAHNRKQNS